MVNATITRNSCQKMFLVLVVKFETAKTPTHKKSKFLSATLHFFATVCNKLSLHQLSYQRSNSHYCFF